MFLFVVGFIISFANSYIVLRFVLNKNELYTIHMRETLKKDHPLIKIEVFDSNYKKVNSILKELGYGGEKAEQNDYVYIWKG